MATDRGLYVGPRLRRMQLQLDNLESAINLVLVTRYAEIASQQPREASVPAPRLER